MQWEDHDLTPQDYADRLQAMVEARRHRKQKIMNKFKFIATRGVLVRRRQKRKHSYVGSYLVLTSRIN